jgi:hypothetical protein
VFVAHDVAMVKGSKGESQGLGVGGPARDYSWPPFHEGHEVNLRHGARSDRYVEPLARAFADVLLADRPDLHAYPEIVVAWATAEARCERFRMYLANHGFIDGTVKNSHDILMFEAQAQRFRERLGLDPLSDATLAKTRADAVLTVVDLEGIRARGREIWARRQAELAAAETVDVEDAEVVNVNERKRDADDE